MKPFDFDLFVIGAGSGGVRAARMAAARGARVAIAESRFFGGTCVNVGCVPKKLFMYGSHFSEEFTDAAGYGWSVGEPRFDWPTLRDNKTAEINRLTGLYKTMLQEAGVHIIEGHARLLDPHTVEVDGSSCRAERILLTPGGYPFIPEDLIGREHVMSSDDLFYMERFPQKVVVVLSLIHI